MPKKIADKVVKKAVKVVKKDSYSLEISFNNQTFKTSSPTLTEALNKFVLSPVYSRFVKTKVIFSYSHGKNKKLRIMPLKQARLVIWNISRNPRDLKFLAEKLTHELG